MKSILFRLVRFILVTFFKNDITPPRSSYTGGILCYDFRFESREWEQEKERNAKRGKK